MHYTVVTVLSPSACPAVHLISLCAFPLLCPGYFDPPPLCHPPSRFIVLFRPLCLTLPFPLTTQSHRLHHILDTPQHNIPAGREGARSNRRCRSKCSAASQLIKGVPCTPPSPRPIPYSAGADLLGAALATARSRLLLTTSSESYITIRHLKTTERGLFTSIRLRQGASLYASTGDSTCRTKIT